MSRLNYSIYNRQTLCGGGLGTSVYPQGWQWKHGEIECPFKVVEMAKTPQWKLDKRKSDENARRILGEKQLNRKK